MPSRSSGSRRRFRAALVGAGFAASSHADALSRLHDVEIAGILASTPERSREAADRLGVDRGYSSLEEVMGDESVDVVHVCTPNRAHAPATLAALEAGKHVVSEKPLGVDLDEAIHLAAAARDANVVAAVCFNYRHYPLMQELRAVLAAGADGPVHMVHGSYLQDWLLEPTDWNWRLDRSEAGASRAVGDIGSHWIDLVQHVTGAAIEAVCAQLGRLHEERLRAPGDTRTFDHADGTGERVRVDTEDMASVLLRFSSGAIGTCTISQVSAGRKNRLHFQIDARETSFGWDQEEPNTLWVGRRRGANRTMLRDPAELDPKVAPLAHFPAGHQEGWPDGMRNLMLDVYAAVGAHGHGEPYGSTFATFAEAVGVARVVEAILESDRAGTWVAVG